MSKIATIALTQITTETATKTTNYDLSQQLKNMTKIKLKIDTKRAINMSTKKSYLNQQLKP
jgi:hypothetical protein